MVCNSSILNQVVEQKNQTPNAFITNDFEIIDFDSENLDQYSLTSSLDDPSFDKSQYDFVADENYSDFDSWARNHLSFEEIWEVPMMNSIWYYPGFVTFTDSDRYKCSGSTTLLLNLELERWGIGLTGGGMDLSPHLLDTFLSLRKGIPLQLAVDVRPDYSGYINEEKHRKNCDNTGLALSEYANRIELKAQRMYRKCIQLSGS